MYFTLKKIVKHNHKRGSKFANNIPHNALLRIFPKKKLVMLHFQHCEERHGKANK
jgi:hypothetical protein